MQGKIAVEEHFALPETTAASARWPTSYWSGINARHLDFFNRRLTEMDASGIELAVLSLNADAIQAMPDVAQASAWFDAVEIAEPDRVKIGRDNARALFALA